jgi:hypothetical protein
MLTAAKTPNFSDVDDGHVPGPEGGIDTYGVEDIIGSVMLIPSSLSVADCENACTVQFHGKSAGIHSVNHASSLATVASLQFPKSIGSDAQVLFTQAYSSRGSFVCVHSVGRCTEAELEQNVVRRMKLPVPIQLPKNVAVHHSSPDETKAL